MVSFTCSTRKCNSHLRFMAYSPSNRFDKILMRLTNSALAYATVLRITSKLNSLAPRYSSEISFYLLLKQKFKLKSRALIFNQLQRGTHRLRIENDSISEISVGTRHLVERTKKSQETRTSLVFKYGFKFNTTEMNQTSGSFFYTYF
ncbi:hypothetical protein BpHYR1_000339 [Brachionus plicatilis]|uniref:Uncharacterized protein n=1 Tax=Brachionus plicatilis TaxID=10195 RepID=A0A3M7SC26_BRAPC|nr:hypothetical protein BpHYR1_000339 [Brachionus plicatilis]